MQDGAARGGAERRGRLRASRGWLGLLLLSALAGPVDADSSGMRLYSTCSSWHGKQGEGNVGANAPALAGLRVAEYSANRIKKPVVGVGHAKKEQVQHMVRRILPSCRVLSADAADALAVAICHAHFGATERAWSAAAAEAAG